MTTTGETSTSRPSLRGYLDVRKLLALHEVALRGSIAKAAAALHVTPGAVSQQMASLEAAVGEPLLVRSASGAVPTETGRRLLTHAEQILAQLDALDLELQHHADGGEATTITVASFASATRQLLAPALRRLLAADPDIAPVVLELDPRDALRAVSSGEVELAVVHGHELRNDTAPSGVELTHLRDEPMLLALPVGHEHADDAVVELGALGDARWILAANDSACHRVALRACAAAGFEPRVCAQSDDWAAVLALVEAGMGVALVPEGVLRGPAAEGAVSVVAPTSAVIRSLHVATRRGERERRIVRDLRAALLEAASGVGA